MLRLTNGHKNHPLIHVVLLSVLLLGLLPTFAYGQANGPVNAAQSDPTWQAQYCNPTLKGLTVLEREDAEINFDWAMGTPDAVVPINRFSVRRTCDVLFEAGEYDFRISSDDGMRVFIDDQLLISKWFDHGLRTWVVRKALTAGHHLLRVEYYDNLGAAVAKVSWQKAGPPSAPSPETVNWHAEYYNNRDLSGTPAVVRAMPHSTLTGVGIHPFRGQVSRDKFSALDTFAAF